MNYLMWMVEVGSGNALIFAGGVVCCFATGPVGFGVGIACAVIGFSDSQGW